VDGNLALERRFRGMVAKRMDDLYHMASSAADEAGAKELARDFLGRALFWGA
jgi:hypothetical protein